MPRNADLVQGFELAKQALDTALWKLLEVSLISVISDEYADMQESLFGLVDVANNSRLRRGVDFRKILTSGIWMDIGHHTR